MKGFLLLEGVLCYQKGHWKGHLVITVVVWWGPSKQMWYSDETDIDFRFQQAKLPVKVTKEGLPKRNLLPPRRKVVTLPSII